MNEHLLTSAGLSENQIFGTILVVLLAVLGILIILAASLLLNGQSLPTETPAPELSAQCAVLMDGDGQILYEKNAHQRCLIASTTKLMTALVAAEHCSPDETVEIPPACCEIEGSSMYLTAGET